MNNDTTILIKRNININTSMTTGRRRDRRGENHFVKYFSVTPANMKPPTPTRPTMTTLTLMSTATNIITSMMRSER